MHGDRPPAQQPQRDGAGQRRPPRRPPARRAPISSSVTSSPAPRLVPVADAPRRCGCGAASAGSGSIFSRSRRTWTVTVDWSPNCQPHTLSSSSARDHARPGWRSRKASRSNSRTVSAQRPRRPRSAIRRPVSTVRSPSRSIAASAAAAGRPRGAAPTGSAAPVRAARTAWSRSRRRRPPARATRSASSPSAVSMTTGSVGQLPAQPPAHLQAVDAGHHQVEHDEVGRARRRPRPAPSAPSAASRTSAAVLLQVAADDVADGRIVVDDQHPMSHPGDATDRSPDARRGLSESLRTGPAAQPDTQRRGADQTRTATRFRPYGSGSTDGLSGGPPEPEHQRQRRRPSTAGAIAATRTGRPVPARTGRSARRRRARPACSTTSWATSTPARKTQHADRSHVGVGERADHGVRHDQRRRRAISAAPHRRARTVIRPTHLVCRTPGRFGAISRAG